MSIFEVIESLPEGATELDWVTTILLNLVNTIQAAIFTACTTAYTLMFEFISDAMTIDSRIGNIGQIIQFSTNVATTILMILFLKQVLTNYVLNVDGEADVDPLQSLVNIAFSLAVINCGEEIFRLALQASNLLQAGLKNAINASVVSSDAVDFGNIMGKTVVAVATAIASSLTGPVAACVALIAIIWGCVLVIMIVVLLCKMVFRAAELFIFRVLWPIFACNLITPNRELWKPFITTYFTTLFGFLVQYLCLMLSLALLFKCSTPNSGAIDMLWNPVLATAFLYFACKAPKWLQQFTYSTGAGQIVSNGARSAVGMAQMAKFIR